MTRAKWSVVPIVAGLLLVGVSSGSPAPAPSAPALTDEQVDAMLLAARELKADLGELRSLPRDAEHADRVVAARDRAARSLESLLTAAGLTREELVRLIDAGSVRTSVEESGEPVSRPLGDARR